MEKDNKKRGRKASARNLKRLTFHIPENHFDLLEEISIEEDMTMAQVVRRAIELYLVTQKDVLSIPESDIALAAHLSETRSKKALVITHAEKFYALHNKEPKEDLSLFEDLNPEAYI